jgi:hypothetical protein
MRVERARLYSPLKNSANPLFCNKGMASARPQIQKNERWALAPARRCFDDLAFFSKLFSRAAKQQNTLGL